MTKEEILKLANSDKFGSWWFLNGGMIHGDWKNKRYSSIRDAATSRAWSAEHDRLITIIQALVESREELREALFKLKGTLDPDFETYILRGHSYATIRFPADKALHEDDKRFAALKEKV